MTRLEPTRALALKVWWAFLWRAFVAIVVCSLAIGIPLGMASAVFGLSKAFVSAITTILSWIVGLGLSVEAMYRVLRKRFAGFEIALISTAPQP